MPVLIENASLIARRSAVEARRLEGWSALAARVGPARTCADAGLVCLSTDDETELFAMVRALAASGLLVEEGGEPADLAIVSQREGPVAWWPWLELGCVAGPGGVPVLAGRLVGDTSGDVVCPEGWRFEGSATESHGVVSLPLPDRPLSHLRRDGQGDLYLDRFTGEEVRLRRSSLPARLAIEATTGERKASLAAEVVRKPLEVEVGLMFREVLAPDSGMLFLFPREGRHPFWMKNTFIPLDLLFLERDGTVAGIVERATPLTTTHRWVRQPSLNVLEVPAGWAAAHGVVPGDRVRIEPGPEVLP